MSAAEKLKIKLATTEEQHEAEGKLERWETGKEQKKRKLEWLLKGRILKSALNIVEGVKGASKSTFNCYLAACVTTGRAMWQGLKTKPARVIWLPGEEDVERSVRPRLDAAKARVDWVIFPPKNAFGIRDILRFPGDTDRLYAQIVHHKATLVIIDPLSSHVPRDYSLISDQDIHAVLDPLSGLAAASGATFVISRNLSKNTRCDPLNRGLGGAAVAGVARSVCTIEWPDRKKPERIMRVTAGNHDPGMGSLQYTISGHKDFGYVMDFKELSVKDDSTNSEDDDDGERSAKDDAKVMLTRLLKEGPCKTVDILKEAKDIGIGAKTVRTVQKKLGIRPVRRVVKGVAFWEWHAPEGGFPKGI